MYIPLKRRSRPLLQAGGVIYERTNDLISLWFRDEMDLLEREQRGRLAYVRVRSLCSVNLSASHLLGMERAGAVRRGEGGRKRSDKSRRSRSCVCACAAPRARSPHCAFAPTDPSVCAPSFKTPSTAPHLHRGLRPQARRLGHTARSLWVRQQARLEPERRTFGVGQRRPPRDNLARVRPQQSAAGRGDDASGEPLRRPVPPLFGGRQGRDRRDGRHSAAARAGRAAVGGAARVADGCWWW